MFPCLPHQKHFFRISRQSSAYNFIVWKCDRCLGHQYLTKAQFYPTYHSEYPSLTWTYLIEPFMGGMTVEQMKAAFKENSAQLKVLYPDINSLFEASPFYRYKRAQDEAFRDAMQAYTLDYYITTKPERWYRRLWKWLNKTMAI